MHDAWPIVTEPFSQWVIEDRFAMGRPDWTVGGAVFSDDIEAWEAMKLRCLNGAHSTLAYLACLSGCETVADAMVEPMIVDAIDALWREVCAVTQAPRGLDATAYVQSLKRRFGNPALRHRTAQIAMDGSQKLPQRLLAHCATALRKPGFARARHGIGRLDALCVRRGARPAAHYA